MNRVEFEKAVDSLTPRKKEVLKLFLMAHSDAEIGSQLCVTSNNISRHISEICKFFGLSNGEGEHYSYRYELFDIFVEHCPEWVSPKKLEEYHPDFQISNRSNTQTINSTEPPFPGRGLIAGSQFYIERSHTEPRSQTAIRQPGGLLRICAPRRMGKTSLLNRLLTYSKDDLGYRTAKLSFYKLEDAMLADLDQMLIWFCETLSHELNLPSTLDNYWNKRIGCKSSCTQYIEDYILANVEGPIIIAMDDVDRLFEFPSVALGFFSLVRGWTEESKIKNVWQNFRQIIAYSTDIYIDFPLSQSPFNIGYPVKLSPFVSEQVVALAKRYGGLRLAKFDAVDAEALLAFIGGTPHLIQLALYHVHSGEISLVDLQSSQQVFMDIYENHLESLMQKLEAYPDLLNIFKQVVASKGLCTIEQPVAKQLIGLGVVQSENGQVRIRSQMYQKYFDQQWS